MTTIDTSRAAVERVLDEELIAELREALGPYDPDVDAQEYWHGLCGSAADRIEALLARAEAAEARADAMRQAVQHANDHADAAIADMETMKAERDAERETVARLTEALETIAHLGEGERIGGIARAALTEAHKDRTDE